MKRKKRTTGWSATGKIDAVALYKKNEFDTKKTAKRLDIAETTLRLWARQQNVTRLYKNVEQIEAETEIIYEDLNHEGFTIDAFRTKLVALQRLKRSVAKEKDIRRLIEAIKVLHDIAPPPIVVEEKSNNISNILKELQLEMEEQAKLSKLQA